MRVIKQFNVLYTLPLAASILFSLALRGLVFKQLLHNTVKAPLSELSHLCITGAAMNILLPARAGDFFRAFYTGQKYNADKVKIFGTVMFERIFDMIVIFVFLSAGVFIYHRNPIALNLCCFAGLCMVFGLIFAVYAYKSKKLDAVCGFLIKKTGSIPFSSAAEKFISFINRTCNSFFNGFDVIEHPKYMFTAVIASFSVWFFECLNFYITMLGFGCSIHWSVTLFLVGFIALACMIPSASIFVGPYQAAVIAAFAIYDVNKETALAISVTEQAVVIISTSLAALIFLAEHNISYKELKEDINSQKDKL